MFSDQGCSPQLQYHNKSVLVTVPEHFFCFHETNFGTELPGVAVSSRNGHRSVRHSNSCLGLSFLSLFPVLFVVAVVCVGRGRGWLIASALDSQARRKANRCDYGTIGTRQWVISRPQRLRRGRGTSCVQTIEPGEGERPAWGEGAYRRRPGVTQTAGAGIGQDKREAQLANSSAPGGDGRCPV